MSFLNATLLFGSLAVLVPIALHLLGRREPQRVQFPAIRFLTQRLKTNRRRMQIKRWVLLTLRALLLALVALALAQPHVHRAMLGDWLAVAGMSLLGCLTLGLFLWAIVAQRTAWLRWSLLAATVVLLVSAVGWGARTLAGGPTVVSSLTAPAAIVFLIDNGPTSSYGQPSSSADDGANSEVDWRLRRAETAALWLLARYPLDGRFAMLDRSARPAAFALEPASVQRSLKNVTPLQTTRPLAERIEAAVRLLRTSDLPRRHLYIFTDLTESSWNVDNGRLNWPSLASEIAQEPKVTITVIDIGDVGYQNRKLGPVELSDPTPPRNVPLSISTLVTWDRAPVLESQAAGTIGGREITVQARMFDQQPGPIERDGKIEYPRLRTVDRKTVRLQTAGERIALTLPPLEYGTHHGFLEIFPSDQLPIDDVRYFTVKVEPPKKILLVCDEAPDRKILSAMLNPFGSEDARREYIIDFATDRTLSNYDFKSYSAIGMFNPGLPPPLVRDELEAWVRAGGNLFVSIGNRLDRDASGEAIEWPLIGNPKRIWRVPEPGEFAQVIQPSHPALAALTSYPGGAPWSAFRIYNYWQLSEQRVFSELLRYAGTEHLALGDQRLDQGRVMLMTTPLPAIVSPADQWNDLLASSLSDAWEVYLILLRQIFEDLTGGLGGSLNFVLGEPVVLSRESDTSTSYQLFAPKLPPVQLDVAQQTVVPGIPSIAGNYWLRGASVEPLGYSANLESEATELMRITTDLLDEALGKDQYQLIREKEEIKLAEGEGGQAQSLYPFAMLMVAAIFILEQILANRFYSTKDPNTRTSVSKRSGSSDGRTVAAA